MGWFDERYPWIPDRCANGHELGEGKVSLPFVPCDCPAVTDGRGHDIACCRVNGCHAAAGPGGCLGRKDAS